MDVVERAGPCAADAVEPGQIREEAAIRRVVWVPQVSLVLSTASLIAGDLAWRDIAGEGEGPMEPDARPCGILAGGVNPVAVDAVLATMIGFDYKKIPLIAKAFEIQDWPLVDFKTEEIEIRSQDDRWKGLKVGKAFDSFRFRPPCGWLGHIESI